MVPPPCPRRSPGRRAPHARGDGPKAGEVSVVPASAPHARGDGPEVRAKNGLAVLCSRARGNGPACLNASPIPDVCSPCTRGWSSRCRRPRRQPGLLPAHARMVPRPVTPPVAPASAPHAGGDGPALIRLANTRFRCSPRTRGLGPVGVLLQRWCGELGQPFTRWSLRKLVTYLRKAPRVQAGQADLVEAVDDIADGVLVGCTNCAITGTRLPPAEASSIIARRYRTELVLPRRTICCSRCPSWSVSLRTQTGSATAPPTVGTDVTVHPSATRANTANIGGQSTSVRRPAPKAVSRKPSNYQADLRPRHLTVGDTIPRPIRQLTPRQTTALWCAAARLNPRRGNHSSSHVSRPRATLQHLANAGRRGPATSPLTR